MRLPIEACFEGTGRPGGIKRANYPMTSTPGARERKRWDGSSSPSLAESGGLFFGCESWYNGFHTDLASTTTTILFNTNSSIEYYIII
jgi:hypothetical protein